MVLKIERFQPEGMNVRMSGGKPSYSHVVTVSGSGKIVYTAGQLARDADGNCVGKGDMRAQMGTDVPEPRPVSQGGRRNLGRRRQDQHLSPTSTSSRGAPTSACAISGWRPRPARPSALPVSPDPIL